MILFPLLVLEVQRKRLVKVEGMVVIQCGSEKEKSMAELPAECGKVDRLSLLWLHKTVPSILLVDSLLTLVLAGLPTSMKKATTWRSPWGKELRVASGQQPARDWGPLSDRGVSPANSHVRLEVDPSLITTQMRHQPWDLDCNLVKDPEAQSLAEPTQTLHLQKLWDKACV